MSLFDALGSNPITQNEDMQISAANKASQGVGVNSQAQSQANAQNLANTGNRIGNGFSQMGSVQAGHLNQLGTDYATNGQQQGLNLVGSGATNQAAGTAEQQATYGQLGNFLANGPAPSVAQAQLQQGENQNVANAMALAASGRGQGGGAAAQQQAAFQNAASGQQTNMQAAQLRAQEAQNWQQTQLAAMGQQGNLGSNLAQQGLATNQLGQSTMQTGQAQQLQAAQSGAQSLLQAGQLGSQNAFNYTNLGQTQMQSDQALRGNMFNNQQAVQAQIAIANQQDQEKANAATLGFVGGLLGGGSSAAGGLGL